LGMFTVVIEHLEPCINRWLLAEYSYVAKLFPGSLVITNVVSSMHREVLSRIAPVYSESASQILRGKVVVLDPWASTRLTPADLSDAEFVVIGGIMGDDPPKRRTETMISKRMPWALRRSLGPSQFTIAGAAYMLKMVSEGRELSTIRVKVGLEVELPFDRFTKLVVRLPYAFPMSNGQPVLPENYIRIVAEGLLLYEQRLLRGDEDVCYEGSG